MFTLTMIIAGFLHSWNMLHYPYYESDEGTYISQAWSLIETGELAPYTYWYDHPPMGWVFIASWVKVIGGDFFKFGTSIDTGRVLMLIVHLISTGLIFYIVHRVTKNVFAALFAGLLFAVSPLMIYFQRRVLLDNIMIMWILMSTAMLFVRNIKLRYYIFSGIFFALALLTKVTAVMFGPALLFYVIVNKNDIPLVFRSTMWLASAMLTASAYILYAFLRGEFFPGEDHVSFIQTFMFQMSRSGADVSFWNSTSDFAIAVGDWMNKDDIGIMVGAGIMVLALIVSFWRKELRFFVIAFSLYFIFLIRGGIVINFYVLPLIPFFAMATAILFYDFASLVSKRDGIRAMIIAVPFLVVVGYYGFYGPTKHFVRDETTQQKEAIVWIKENLPEDSAIAIDAYALVDIRDPHNINDKTFPDADWFYKVNRDPMIRDDKYNADWKNFDYIALTHEMLRQVKTDDNPIVKEAYRNALPVAKWMGNTETFVDEQTFRTTNGDWAMIFKVNGEHHAQLLDAWEKYKKDYVVFDGENYGQVIDPQEGVTTSEGQSYAMLRAAWMNDKYTFLGAWLWTRNHLQHRLNDDLLSWKWQDGTLVDSANATDADEDIALALLFGYKLWNEEEYLIEAQSIIDDIWEHCVVKINGRYYLLPMHEESADKWNGYLFNPSYLSPASYRIFAEVDPKHDWDALADDSYTILNEIGELEENNTYLPADWYFLDKKYGAFYTANPYFERDVDNFSFDAFRTLWRVSLDEQWFGTQQAREYLQNTSVFLEEYNNTHDRFPMIMSLEGEAMSEHRATSVDVGYAIGLMYGENPENAQEFFATFVDERYDVETHSWDESLNYYNANWAWFGTGVFRHALQNIWDLNVLKDK